MNDIHSMEARQRALPILTAMIFDVDGVILASPHEQAWRDALNGLTDPKRFTTAMYQASVAGKPRLIGAQAALEALGISGASGLAESYAEAKQKRLEALMGSGHVQAFPDALRLVRAVRALKWPMAVASSSKNAEHMLRSIHLDDVDLLDVFKGDVCGRDLAHGKPAPDIFLLAAKSLGIEPSHCVVVEDAPAGIEAAHAGGMTSLGIARLADADGLWAAKADLVVASLDDVSMDSLAEGRLCRRMN